MVQPYKILITYVVSIFDHRAPVSYHPILVSYCNKCFYTLIWPKAFYAFQEKALRHQFLSEGLGLHPSSGDPDLAAQKFQAIFIGSDALGKNRRDDLCCILYIRYSICRAVVGRGELYYCANIVSVIDQALRARIRGDSQGACGMSYYICFCVVATREAVIEITYAMLQRSPNIIAKFSDAIAPRISYNRSIDYIIAVCIN